MSSNRIENIQLLYTSRNMRHRGPTSSYAMNDLVAETAHDLANFADQWNNRLTPLTATLPNGSPTSAVDAFANGLDGKNMYVNSGATSGSYYASSYSRPTTIYEQFINVYSAIDTLQTALEEEIADTLPIAEEVNISDADGLYDATHVEGALAEVKTAVNQLETSLDLSAVAQNYVLADDNTYDIGSTTQRLRHLRIGSDLTVGNSIGIGTTSPVSLLHVGVSDIPIDNWITVGRSGLSEGGFQWDRQGTIDAQIYIDASEDMIIKNNFLNSDFKINLNIGEVETDVFFIKGATGNVGIGTTAPTQKLHIGGTGASTIKIESSTASAATSISLGSGGSGNRYAFIDLTADDTYDYGDRLIRNNTGANAITEFRHRGTGNLRFTSVEASSIIFNTDSVGIGNTTPTAEAILDLETTANLGMRLPLLTNAQQGALTTEGLLIYNTTSGVVSVRGTTGWLPLH